MSVFLFDMAGDPIAFRRTWNDPHLFSLSGRWIGWCPWEDNHVVGPDGHYLASVVDDRLVRRNDWCDRPCTQHPDHPDAVTPDTAPPMPHSFPNRFAYQDIAVAADDRTAAPLASPSIQ